ncbi:phage major capsid protein, partial [Aeoliella sp. ICT_H6.2]
VALGDGREIEFMGGGNRDEETPSIGAVIHHAITGSDRFIDGKMAAALVPGGSDSKGFLLSERLGNQVYDLARAKSVVSRAGAVTVPITDGRTLTLASVASDPTSYWRHESVPVTASEVTFSAKNMQLRTLAVLIPLTVELVEDAPNIVDIIESTIAASLALKMDQAALTGTASSGEPGGILNETGVNEESSVGTPANYVEVSAAIEDILTANYPGEDATGLAWIANPRDFATYDGLTDTTNQPLMPTPWASQLRRMSTTSLEASAGATSMIVGDFTQAIMGVKPGGMRFEILRQGSAVDSESTEYNAVSQMLVWVRAYIRMDTAFIKPQFFTKLTGVTAS